MNDEPINVPADSGAVDESPVTQLADVLTLQVRLFDQGHRLHALATRLPGNRIGVDPFYAILENFADLLQSDNPLAEDFVRKVKHLRLAL